MGIEVSHRSKNSQPGTYCSLGVIFMSYRKAEVDQETIAQELSDMPIVALDNVGTHSLICTDHVTPVFRVELRGQFRGVHQIAKHDGELTTFGLRCGPASGGPYALRRLGVLRVRQRRGSEGGRVARVARPD